MRNCIRSHEWRFSDTLEGEYCAHCFTLVNPWQEAIRKGWYFPNAVPPEPAWDTEEHRNLTYLLDECPALFANPETDKPKGASHVNTLTTQPAQLKLSLIFT